VGVAEKTPGAVQSVQRALHLLSHFAPRRTDVAFHRKAWTVSDLARATGLHKSVVARLMSTMALEGFVAQDPMSKAYSVGPEAFAVGNAYEPYFILNQVARPVMEDLTARCGHASYLGVPSGDHYVFLIAVESIRSVRVAIGVGERRAFHTGAIGKVLLAAMPEGRERAILGVGPLPQMTPHTITDVDLLLAQLAEVRRTGVAINHQESILGAGSVAVGVHNATGECVAGLAVVYPTHVVTDAEIDGLTRVVAAAGSEVSRRLGAFSRQPDAEAPLQGGWGGRRSREHPPGVGPERGTVLGDTLVRVSRRRGGG
jgi:DNA-binding IclR family transcriptional regulator